MDMDVGVAQKYLLFITIIIIIIISIYNSSQVVGV